MAPEGHLQTVFKRPAGSPAGSPSPNKKQKLSQKGQQAKSPQATPSPAQKSPNPNKYFKTQLDQERRALPIFQARSKFIKQMQGLSTAIVIGETGSGKTTQIPQYLLEAGLHKDQIIACTQPRRVAAITIAQRVAAEKKTEIGRLVGYSVRFDDMTSDATKIKYMTDGMLLREAILDPLLKRYSVIILDEAHERTVHTDVLFGVIKKAQKKRRIRKLIPLKILIMSATMDVDHFSQYFNNAPVLYLEGRLHPIQLMYTKKPQSDYMWSTIVSVFQIHKKAPAQEDILVFLTGQEEIEAVVKNIRDISKELKKGPNLIVLPLYAALPAPQQLRVFQKTPPGSRKVIVSTNIAETSVTISGIKFVIDAGMVKAKTYDAHSRLDLLRVQRISQAQAWQRTGRAGREAPGSCYRLYTEQEFDTFRKNTQPEIQRCNLSSVVLQMLAMGIKDVVNFDFMDKPTQQSLKLCLNELRLLGAIQTAESQELPKLTELGKHMAAYPLDPSLSKCVLAAAERGCLEEILTVVSMLYVDAVLFTPHNKREHAIEVHKKFLSPDGDHITLLNVYRAYNSAKGNKNWCFENFVNARNMKQVVEVRKQLRDICVSKGLKLGSCGSDTAELRKCLAVGFFMKSAELHREGHYLTMAKRKPVHIHPSSSLFQRKPSYVLYTELILTTKCYMRDLCVVDADWLYDAAPEYFRRKKEQR